MASSTCLASLVLKLGDGKSRVVSPHHFLMHTHYHTASEVSAGSFSWVVFLVLFWHLLQTVIYGMDTSGSAAGEPLWLVGWYLKSSVLICCAKEDVLLQFFHDSEKQRNPKGHMVVCDLFYGLIWYCHSAFSLTTVSQLDWIDSAKVQDLHNNRTSFIQNSLANAHQRDEIKYGMWIFFF